MLSKSAARAFFLSGTLLFGAVFIWLTVDTFQRIPAQTNAGDLKSQKERDNPLVHSFEKVHTATEYQSGRKQLDGSDQLAEQEEALDELELTKLTRTTETAQSIYRADLQAGLHTADFAEEPELTRAHRYPEWNFKRREYRADWCTVNEHLSPPSAPASTGMAASRRLHGEVLQLQAELKRLELDRRWRNRQLDGSEIDIDLLTDAKPTDYDHYEGRYGIEDVRQALREASEQGTHCLALAVRDKGEAYLTQMFGTHGWMLLPDVHSLPSHFVSVATNFLKS